MIKGGYILQPRIIDKSESMNFNPTTREVWQFILRKANHKDNGKFKRGQCFLSLKDIQDGLSWYIGYRKMTYSKPQLTKALRRLSDGNTIETTKEIRGMTITICNYDYYQDPKNYEGNDADNTKGEQRSKGGHTINKNDKNVKNEINIIMPFDSEIFKTKWQEWKEYRNEIKHPYKNDKSEQRALNAFVGYDEDIVLKAIQKSMDNTYQGIFLPENKVVSNKSKFSFI